MVISSSLRDSLLQRLGIVQYQLRRPAVLHGEVAVVIPSATRLIVIAEQLPVLSDPFFHDIMQALGLRSEAIYCLTPERAVMLPDKVHCALWLVGNIEIKAVSEHQLASPTFNELNCSPALKRAFWQKIYQNESYFSTVS